MAEKMQQRIGRSSCFCTRVLYVTSFRFRCGFDRHRYAVMNSQLCPRGLSRMQIIWDDSNPILNHLNLSYIISHETNEALPNSSGLPLGLQTKAWMEGFSGHFCGEKKQDLTWSDLTSEFIYIYIYHMFLKSLAVYSFVLNAFVKSWSKLQSETFSFKPGVCSSSFKKPAHLGRLENLGLKLAGPVGLAA